MKKPVFICLLFAVLFAVNISAQNATVPHSEGDFSINVPAGWQLTNLGLKYAALMGPADGGFSPNMNFIEEDFPGTVTYYIDIAIPMLQSVYNNFQLIRRGNFTTDSGLQGEYIVIQAEIFNTPVWMKQYILQSKSGTTLMIISTGAAVTLADKYEELYDGCAKTFNWSR
jgi:hypothetical protein